MLVGFGSVQAAVSGTILLIFCFLSVKYVSRLRKYNNETSNIFWVQSTQYKPLGYGLNDRGILIRMPPGADFFKRVRKLAKSDYSLRHACLFVLQHATARLTPDEFS